MQSKSYQIEIDKMSRNLYDFSMDSGRVDYRKQLEWLVVLFTVFSVLMASCIFMGQLKKCLLA